MNSRQAQQALRVTRQTQGKGHTPRKVTHPATPVALRVETGTRLTPVNTAAAGSPRHPLANQHANARLAHCEETVKGRFEAIAPAL